MCECLAIWEESEIYNQKNLCYTCNIMRNYIVFDLEWNQSSGGRDCSSPRLAFEIFEIGAVKLNENFEKVVEEFDRFGCRMVQHELSHLEGNLFVDNISPIRRKMIARKLQAISKGSVQTRYKSKR